MLLDCASTSFGCRSLSASLLLLLVVVSTWQQWLRGDGAAAKGRLPGTEAILAGVFLSIKDLEALFS